MTTFPLGWAIHRLGIVNPAGWVIDHKIRELGIIPKQLKEELGCEANYISMLRSKTGKPPSFHTSLGRTLVTEIWKAEGQRPELLTETERKNPRRRYAALLDGLTLLSVFKPPRKGEAEPHAFFTRMAEMAGHHAHAQALTLMGEAIYGRLDERPHLKALPPPPHRWATRSPFRNQAMGRRAFAQSLAQVDAYSGPEDLFAYGAQPFIDEGKRKAAIDRAAMAFDGLREAEEDRMRELMDDDRDDEQLLPGHGDPAHVERTPFH